MDRFGGRAGLLRVTLAALAAPVTSAKVAPSTDFHLGLNGHRRLGAGAAGRALRQELIVDPGILRSNMQGGRLGREEEASWDH